MNEEITQIKVTLESIAKSVDGLTLSVDDLPTRIEIDRVLAGIEQRLEKQIDSLAISAKNEFDRVHVRLDEIEKYTIEFKELFASKANGFQNQLDTIYTRYPNRMEFDRVDKRLKKVEKVVFA